MKNQNGFATLEIIIVLSIISVLAFVAVPKISAMFDNDPLKIGVKFNNKEVFHISNLPDIVDKFGVKIAILTVPRKFAQEVTNFLTDKGIKYIWNFTPCVLNVPTDVQVWNENLIGNFLQFTVGFEDN